MDRHQETSGIYVNPASPTRRVEKKGRKWRALEDPSWDEALKEHLEKIGASAPEALKKNEDLKVKTSEAPAGYEREQGTELCINSEEDFDKIIDEIKKMADDPEKLVESHIKVFTEPVSNGKLLDSQG
jgi:hypothetical protein